MIVLEFFLIVYKYDLYHGQRKSDIKDKWKYLRMSLQLVNESLYNDTHREYKSTDHICQSS